MAVTVRINHKSVQKKINLALIRKAKPLIVSELTNRLNSEKERFLFEIENHPISQEINAGAGLDSSEFINAPGNLFSFIGFHEGDSPIDEVLSYIDKNTKILHKSISTKEQKNGVQFKVPINAPTETSLASVSPMPWGTAKSWIHAVERDGISGINRYLYSRNREFASSRSGPAVQVKNELRSTTDYQPQPYIFELLKEFKQSLRNN